MNIKDHLKKIRKAAIRHDLMVIAWISYSILLVVIIIAGLLENVFYFSPSIRLSFLLILAYVLIVLVIFTIIFLILAMTGVMPHYRLPVLAMHVGKIVFTHHDRVNIALELETASIPPDFSKGHDRSFISQTSEKLGTLDYASLFSNRNIVRWKTIAVILLMFAGILILFNWDKSVNTILRWSHPREEFQALQTSGIISKSGDIHLRGGTAAVVEFIVQGDQPDSIYLRLNAVPGTNPLPGISATTTLASSFDPKGIYSFNISSISSDLLYQAYYPIQHFLQTQSLVESPEYYILVSDLPVIEDLTITITPPPHTGQFPQNHDLDQSVIRTLKGSQIAMSVASNLELHSASVTFDNLESIELDVDGRTASGSFELQADGTFYILMIDHRGITNRDSIKYHLLAGNDLPPELQVIRPPPVMQVGSKMILPYQLNIDDDFGFSNLQLSYETLRRRDSGKFTQAASLKIPGLYESRLSQEIRSSWDLSPLNLVPGDILQFHFELEDNDPVSGPKKSLSETIHIQIVSQPELYESWFKEQNIVFQDFQKVSGQLLSYEQQLHELSRTISEANNSELSQQNDTRRLLKTSLSEIEKLSFALSIIDSLYDLEYDLKLFSQDLRVRMNKLRDQMQLQYRTGFLAQIEADLNNLYNTQTKVYPAVESLEENNDDSILRSMKVIQSTLRNVTRSLDHALGIIPQLIAEQHLDQLIMELSRLIASENDLVTETGILNRSSTGPGSELPPSLDQESMVGSSRRNLEDFTYITNQSINTMNIFKDIHSATALRLETLRQSPLGKSIMNDLRKSISELRSGSLQNALNTNQSAALSLRLMKDELDNIRTELRKSTVQATETTTRTILSNILMLHKQQESLLSNTRQTLNKLQSSSELSFKSSELASRQRFIREKLEGSQSSLSQLATRSFSVTQELWLTIHKADSNMVSAAIELEEGNIVAAIEHQFKSKELLNTFFITMFTSMRRMDKTGFDPFSPLIDSETQNLITTQQKLLDQGAFLLNEDLRPDVRQYLIRKIVTGQLDLQRALYALSNIGGKNRIFDRTAHRNIQLDIQEIIEELNNDHYDRETYELQQSIFDRLQEEQLALLSSEESGEHSRDIKRSESSETGTITFPDTAPEPVQKKDLIAAALEASLSAGYPSEYEEMIRNYFTLLIEAESDEIANPNNQFRPSGDDQFNNHRNRN
jgi:hypothetical protein